MGWQNQSSVAGHKHPGPQPLLRARRFVPQSLALGAAYGDSRPEFGGSFSPPGRVRCQAHGGGAEAVVSIRGDSQGIFAISVSLSVWESGGRAGGGTLTCVSHPGPPQGGA